MITIRRGQVGVSAQKKFGMCKLSWEAKPEDVEPGTTNKPFQVKSNKDRGPKGVTGK